MYTSCAWFFDDIAGIEPVQIMKYAGRLIDLGNITGLKLPEKKFLETLEQARSNGDESGSGRDIFMHRVESEHFSLKKICGHHAIQKMINPDFIDGSIHIYKITTDFYKQSSFNQLTLSAAKITLYCSITHKPFPFEYFTLHFSGLDFNVYVQYGDRGEDFIQIMEKAFKLFEEQGLTELIRYLPRYFGDKYYTLNDLFKDDRYQIIELIDKGSIDRLGNTFLDFFAENKKLFVQLTNAHYPLPKLYHSVIDYAINYRLVDYLNRLIENGETNEAELSFKIIQHIILMRQWGFKLSKENINSVILPDLVKILGKVLSGNVSPHNFLEIMREFDQLGADIDYWLLQDRLLAYMVSNPESELFLQEDFQELCIFMNIRIEDFVN